MNLHFTAERIRDLRARLGLTQIQFAGELDVSQAAVAQWESGECKPSRPAILEALVRLESGEGKAAV